MTPFPHLPNWSEPVVEQLAWLTHVPVSLDGSEPLRSPMRLYPRAVLEASYTLPSSALDTLRTGAVVLVPYAPALMRRTGSVVPVSASLAALSATSDYLAWLPDGSTAQITASAPSPAPADTDDLGLAGTAAGSTGDAVAVAPLIACTLENLRVQHLTDAIATCRLRFQSIAALAEQPLIATDLRTFSGSLVDLPLLIADNALLRPSWSSGQAEAVDFSRDAFEYAGGTLLALMHSKQSYTLSLNIQGAQALRALRQFLFSVKGRHASFVSVATGAAGTFRLGADLVEIAYTTDSVASCSLQLVRLD